MYFPEFSFTRGLHIQQNKISPYGGDNHIQIVADSREKTYWVPESLQMPQELLDEYSIMRLKGPLSYFRIRGTSGWRSHNVDFRDVFYKNLVIALDNAVVRQKYSDQSQQRGED